MRSTREWVIFFSEVAIISFAAWVVWISLFWPGGYAADASQRVKDAAGVVCGFLPLIYAIRRLS